jgi:hypothetical protein
MAGIYIYSNDRKCDGERKMNAKGPEKVSCRLNTGKGSETEKGSMSGVAA